MNELSREGGWVQVERGKAARGGEPARHWPPESVAKEGLAGGDGAVIGVSESSDWRLGQVSQQRWMCLPVTEGKGDRCGQRARKT